MSKLLSPQVTLSPTDFNTSGTLINATVSILNRPDYLGDPDGIAGLTEIYPKIVISRSPSGIIPFHVMVSACETTHNGSGGEIDGNAFSHLDYRWDFGDPSGTEIDMDYYNNSIINLNTQYSPQAAYCYRNTGEYIITLTVKGKKTDGTYVTASTNTIYQLGEYYVHLGAAISGTYTLSFNGETTAPIAYNATNSNILTALTTLSPLNSGNVYMSDFGMIQFHDDLMDIPYSFSGDFSNITQTSGLENTPRILVEESPASFSGVIVNDMSSLSIQYYDSNYDGSNGVGNGTFERPYTDYTTARSWIEGGGLRGMALKRGSIFDMDTRIEFPTVAHNTIRIFSYGTGAQPIIRNIAANSYFNFRLGKGAASQPNGRMMDDIVFSDIELDFANGISTTPDSIFVLVVDQANAGAWPHVRLKNVVLDKVTWSSSAVDPNPSITPPARCFDATVSPSKGGTLFSRFGVWRCNMDGTGSTQAGFVLCSMAEWISIIGGRYGKGGPVGITPINALIHSFYPSFKKYGMFKHLGFYGPSWKNMCINTNAKAFGNRVSYVVYDGCDFAGHQNCVDLSNENNSWSGGRNGHFDQVVMSACKFHSGQLTSQQIGIYISNIFRLTIQHCDFYGNNQNQIALSATTGYPFPPELRCWHTNFKDGVMQIRGVIGKEPFRRFSHCSFESTNGDYCLEFYNETVNYITDWILNDNIYYSSLSSPFSDFTWAEWEALGHDINSQNIQPNWPAALSGIFVNSPTVSIDWPDGFTNLEYSLDNSGWSSYTELSDISLGASASGLTEIYFRASAPQADGSFIINSYSDSSTVNTISESGYAILTSSLPPANFLYYKLHFDNNLLILKRVE